MTTKKFDLQAWLGSSQRDIRRDGKRIRSVAIRREYDAPIDRVWSAWTEGWRTKIVSGDAAVGETVVLDLGQPHRTTCKILVCDAPSRLAVTWTYGESTEDPTRSGPDEVEVRLTAKGTATVLELEHRSDNEAPWAGGVGAGWEAGLIMFDFMYRGEDPTPAFATFPELDTYWTALVAE
jgi:uncharacterized protein YndB with AHSA1/START domain